MQRLRGLGLLGIALVLNACSLSGEDAAQQWVQDRTPGLLPDPSLVLPPIIDTPPEAYTALKVVDPFSPGRIEQLRQSSHWAPKDASGRGYFTDLSIDTLRVVGFLEVRGQYVAIVEGSSGFVNAKVMDRLGNQRLEIVEISAKGIRVRQADGAESWMPISRRGRQE